MLEKNKKLYEGAKTYREKQDILLNPYVVYVESLYDALFSTSYDSTHRDLACSVFNNLLDDWIKDGREYDETLLRNEFRTRYRRAPKVHDILLGIPLATETIRNFPFKRSIIIKDITYKVCSYKYAKEATDGHYIQELENTLINQKYSRASAASILQNNFMYFSVQVRASSENVAVNKALEYFQWFAASVSVAEERFTSVYTHGTYRTKSRKCISNPSLIYLLNNNPNTAVYVSSSPNMDVPSATLKSHKKEITYKRYKKYLKIFLNNKPTLIEKRTKQVMLEFDAALGSTDPHARALGLWRCIEIACKKSGQQRTQVEMIDIFSKYYDDDFWSQIGQLILKARNSYVHEGVEFSGEMKDYYLMWLQSYASAALSLLFWIKEHKLGNSDEDIDSFFDYYNKSNASLAVATKIHTARKHFK